MHLPPTDNPLRPHGPPSPHGFTLVELLVVISIIALLLGILIPSLSKARRVAAAAADLSNLRQLELAHQSYLNAYNGVMIDVGLGHDGGAHADENRTWVKSLTDFYTNYQDTGRGEEIRARSPLDDSPHWGPAPEGEPLPDAPEDQQDQRRRTSYGLNDYLTSAAPTEAQRHRRINQVRRPADTVHAFHMAYTGSFAGADHAHPTGWFRESGPPPHARASAESQTHAVEGERGSADARSNYVFLDGHAATHAFKEVGVNAENNRFNPDPGS